MNMSGLAKGMIAGALLASGGIAQAQQAWTGPRHVTAIYPHSGGFVFNLDGAWIGPAACGNRFYLPMASAGASYDAIVATLITAFSAGYWVDANYDVSTINTCDIIINRVIVTK